MTTWLNHLVKPSNQKMKKYQQDTEQRIFEAALVIFIRKGMSDARMQEIADEACINKSLLHYYYRTKEKLFDAVFREAFSQMAPMIVDTFKTDENIITKIKIFIEKYIEILKENPHIPAFVLHELQKNPNKIVEFIRGQGIAPELIIKQIQKDVKKGIIKPIDPHHLIVNIISMCIFPFAARPVIQSLIFKNKKKDYDKFLNERKKEITDFVIKSITNK